MHSVTERRVVWVVDDSPRDAMRAQRVLAGLYQVELMADGPACLERLAHETPDVVILDWVMPAMSGLEVCQFMRTSGLHSLAILMLTVQSDSQQIVQGLLTGANDYLAKPYEDEELLARVAALIRWRQLLARAEHAEAANRQLLHSTPDPMLVIDRSGALSFLNEKAAQMLHEAGERLLGRQIAELIPALAGCESYGECGAALPLTGDLSVGERLYSPVLTSVDNSVTISLRDVTEQRLSEARRLDLYSIVAHDLRTPLAAMSLRIAHLLQGDDLKNEPALASDIGQLDLELRSSMSTINTFLDYTSLDASLDPLQRVELELNGLLQSALEPLRHRLDEKQLVYQSSASEPASVVLGDERRLRQAIANLLENAIQFTPPGGSIVARIVNLQRSVELSISDTGPGIPQHAQPTLFERYSRTEHTVGGTGLGLMIVKEIIEAHGGLLGVDSSEAQGSRFWLRLRRE